MPLFERTILIPKGIYIKFSFNRIYTVNGYIFLVFAIQRDNNHFVIRMQSFLGVWKIVNKVPDWLLEVEQELATEISHHIDD